MAKSFPSVAGFEHLKGPSLLASTTMALGAVLTVIDIFTVIQFRADLPTLIAYFAEATILTRYLALLAFFFLLYRSLVGAAVATYMGRSALVAATAIGLRTILDTYFRLMPGWNLMAFLQ